MDKKNAALGQSAEKKPIKKASGEAKTTVKKSALKPTEAKKSTSAQGAAKTTGKKKLSRKKKRALRIKRILRTSIVFAALVLLFVAFFFLNNAVIGGKVYPLSTQSIDLRGGNLSDAGGIARLTELKQALLADNNLQDVSALAALSECEYIDLTGNPVSAESYAALRSALPSCMILCEAEDTVTAELALGGYELPDFEALCRVFESHKALETVDLRGTDLTQAEITALCDHFAHIDFIYLSASSADTLVISIDQPSDAAAAIERVGDAAHITVTGCAFTPGEYHTLQDHFPDLTLDCLISLYGRNFPSTASAVNLSGCTTDDFLLQNLSVFPALRWLTLSEAIPSKAIELKAALALDELTYKYNGISITPELTEIDLRGAQGLTASELELLLSMLPNLQTVMMDAPEEDALLDVIRLRKNDIRFAYEVQAFGQTFDAYTEVIDLGASVSDGDAEKLSALIRQLPSLKEALMYDSRLSQKSMDLLFDSHPDIFFGWTVSMCDGKYVFRTDITAFSTQIGQPVNFYTEEHLSQLRYCKRLKALDLGHNNIHSIDFLYNFPDMKVLILVDNKFTDITPIASLTQLEYLEIFMNNGIRDFTPLVNLPLKHLNICFCGDKDNKVTADLFMQITTLERFWASRTYFDKEEGQRLSKALPDCTVSVTYGESTGDGWRRGAIYPVIVRMFETGVYEPLP